MESSTAVDLLKKKKLKTDGEFTAALIPGDERSTARKGSGPKVCQAEKCSVDLSFAKAYHRRHKVCEQHSKAPAVMVAGIRQRFCQQCSRFHELSEFDETKRSCRRRLAGHNERRRKNPTENSQADGGGGRMKCGDQMTDAVETQVEREDTRVRVDANGNFNQFHVS